MYNLDKIIKFEIIKQLRKPQFWLAVMIFPVIMLLFGAISYFSAEIASKQVEVAETKTKDYITNIIMVDHSDIVKADLFGEIKVTKLDNEEEARAKFQTSDAKTALVIYPAKPTEAAIQTYTKLTDDQAQTQQNSTGFSALTRTVLINSATAQVDSKLAEVIAGKNLSSQAKIIDQNNQVYNPMQKMVLPGIFLAVFFLVFTITGNQILVATTEEKENRVAEMLLTTIDAKTMITGKIIALVALGFIQILAILLPILLIYFAGTQMNLIPPFLADLIDGAKFEFWPFFFGLNLLIFGFLMTTGFTIFVGSLFPTAQDASQFYAPIVLVSMIPLYFMAAIMSGVKNLFVQILSYFPLTAPTTLLVRNTVGNLSITEGLIGLSIVILAGFIVMTMAVRAFKHGVFEYSKPATLKDAISRAGR